MSATRPLIMQSPLLALLLTATTLASTAGDAPARIDELLRQEKWAEALPLLEQAVAATPADAEAHFRLGSTRLHHGDLKEAIAALAQATALAPTNSEYFRLLAAAYGNSAQQAGLLAKMGLARKFVAAINRSIALDPANLAARLALLEFARQAPGIVGGGLDKAYAQAAEIKKLDPVQGRRAYASLYLSEKKYPEALAAHEELLRDRPEDYSSLYAVGRIAALSGERPERGIECLRRCLALPPPPNTPSHAAAHWRLGNLWEKMGDPAAARAAYETALKLEPGFAEAAAALKQLR